MIRPRLTAALVAGAVAAAALPAAAPAASTTTKTYKIASGTTKLTLDPAAVANLASMSITMSGVAPATTVGPLLTFPLKSGSTIKTKTRGTARVVSGNVVHTGTLQMAQGQVLVALTKPTIVFGAAPVLTGSLGGLAVPVGNLSFTKAKTTVSKTSLKISGISMKLTKLAADSMNATFSVTGFHEGDKVGTAVMSAKLKK